MNKKYFVKEISVLLFLVLMLPSVTVFATNTGSLIAVNISGHTAPLNDDEPFEGYILYIPYLKRTTYLLNNTKQVVKKWYNSYPGMDVHLLENGNLIYTYDLFNIYFSGYGGCTGGVEMFDWNGTFLWNFILSNNNRCLHHDIEPLPNGNILMSVWEKKTRNQAIASGRNPNSIFNLYMAVDYIIEVDPTKPDSDNIFWEWHAWDHLIQDYDSSKANYGVVGDHPELVDINYASSQYTSSDWMHTNSIDYNEEFDQIMISVNNFNEIFVIDHSTTTEEAAGHTGGNSEKGGDILYRWGNPEAYRAGNSNDRKLFSQHDARWVEPGYPGDGHITIFNTDASSIDEIVPPVDVNGYYTLTPGDAYGPDDFIWRYQVHGWSGAQRLPDGNTLISSDNSFIVVTPEKNIVWRYNISSTSWKMEYYPLDYPGSKSLSHNMENSQSNQCIFYNSPSNTQQSMISSTTTTEKNTRVHLQILPPEKQAKQK